jgi:hypothetical protein
LLQLARGLLWWAGFDGEICPWPVRVAGEHMHDPTGFGSSAVAARTNDARDLVRHPA